MAEIFRLFRVKEIAKLHQIVLEPLISKTIGLHLIFQVIKTHISDQNFVLFLVNPFIILEVLY